jgi:hypothetical protein
MSNRKHITVFTHFEGDTSRYSCFSTEVFTNVYTVEEMIKKAVSWGTGKHSPVAWGYVHTGAKTSQEERSRLVQEAINEGRVVTMVDGTWVAHGQEKKPPSLGDLLRQKLDLDAALSEEAQKVYEERYMHPKDLAMIKRDGIPKGTVPALVNTCVETACLPTYSGLGVVSSFGRWG